MFAKIDASTVEGAGLHVDILETRRFLLAIEVHGPARIDGLAALHPNGFKVVVCFLRACRLEDQPIDADRRIVEVRTRPGTVLWQP